MSERVYEGSCHCGLVLFSAHLDLSTEAPQPLMCNCSICSRKGAIMRFVGADKFVLRQGKDSLTDYQFGKRHIHHTFCSTCGIHAFAHGADENGKSTYCVNLNCLPEVDGSGLKIQRYDGKSR